MQMPGGKELLVRLRERQKASVAGVEQVRGLVGDVVGGLVGNCKDCRGPVTSQMSFLIYDPI